MGDDQIWLDGSKTEIDVASGGRVMLSADGTMYAHAYDRRPEVDVEGFDGKSRTFTMKDDNVLAVEGWAGSSGVIVRMHYGGYRLIDVKTGKVSTLDADHSPVVFGKLV
ncbi:hypothetical protein SAMN05444920_104800 [Nonomuraea solani]|uniref:Uncharacterized protein n=1 Tax=Nonomuraea solani TaxID=1144553 RepID=A0A1H6D450_9ACTN|nr:hypothetical protein [Nonomuraea solani]SEG80102.1 hypothetical protein SAMN05444920_104800 [Nonomuraea solani]